ncbi:site-specific integrase [Candidatus Parcubacteria bacterium]|nr:MAG: site-specific integrase [Candidatus Parcubacteria bacterium]
MRREQAAAAMLFASGMRSSAFGSLPIEAVDLEKMEIRQWPSLGVRTKNGKHATTYLLDIPELIDVIREWDSLIREQLPPEAMWYAPFRTDHFGNKTKLSSASAGKNRNQAIAKGLRKLYRAANLPYKSPHKFRHGHAVHALLGARTMAAYKAVSQNLMHGSIKVTDEVYAWLNEDDVRTQISSLAVGQSQSLNPDDELRNYLNSLSKHDLEKAINHAARLLANG